MVEIVTRSGGRRPPNVTLLFDKEQLWLLSHRHRGKITGADFRFLAIFFAGGFFCFFSAFGDFFRLCIFFAERDFAAASILRMI